MFAILAPGPSLTAELCERVRHLPTIAVCNAFQLAPWAQYLAANDGSWWRRHPEAQKFKGRKFSGNELKDVERVLPNTFGTSSNSGVLALDLARNLGATEVLLLGFDMHGSHFFGNYTNGCSNTPPHRRLQHQQQFKDWARQNGAVQVLNCTPKSALTCFPVSRLEGVIGTDCSIRAPSVSTA